MQVIIICDSNYNGWWKEQKKLIGTFWNTANKKYTGKETLFWEKFTELSPHSSNQDVFLKAFS